MSKYPKHIRNRVLIGHCLVSFPALLLCFGPLFLIIPQLEYSGVRVMGSVILFIGGLALTWLFWSSMIAKWRLWAFSGLGAEDMYLLKQSALNYYLIWEDSSRIGKTEIRRTVEKNRIAKFEKKIEEYESLQFILLMASLPDKKHYGINKSVLVMGLCLKFVLIILTGLFGLMELYWFSCLSLLLLLISGDSHYYIRSGLKKQPFFTLSNAGISVSGKVDREFKWEDINDFRFSRTYKILSIDYKEEGILKRIAISMSPYKITKLGIFEMVISIYRQRHSLQREIKSKGMDY